MVSIEFPFWTKIIFSTEFSHQLGNVNCPNSVENIIFIRNGNSTETIVKVSNI